MQSTSIESNNLGVLLFYYYGVFYMYKSFLILDSLLGKCKVPSPPHGSTVAFQIVRRGFNIGLIYFLHNLALRNDGAFSTETCTQKFAWSHVQE